MLFLVNKIEILKDKNIFLEWKLVEENPKEGEWIKQEIEWIEKSRSFLSIILSHKNRFIDFNGLEDFKEKIISLYKKIEDKIPSEISEEIFFAVYLSEEKSHFEKDFDFFIKQKDLQYLYALENFEEIKKIAKEIEEELKQYL